MKNLTTVGRILFALPFAVFGINHFVMLDYYMGMLTSFIPLGAYTVIFTGILLIAASVAIIACRFVKQATFLLSGMLLIFILTIHLPHLLGDSTEKTTVLITLLKDISLLGGSLLIAGMSAEKEKLAEQNKQKI